MASGPAPVTGALTITFNTSSVILQNMAQGRCIRCDRVFDPPPDMSEGAWIPVDLAAGTFICPKCNKGSL